MRYTSSKINALITIAQTRMRDSADPFHDIGHATRVAATAAELAGVGDFTAAEQEALALAAWWHDVGRTVYRRPSFILMVLLDDLLSALMLWRETIRLGLFGSVAGMATRLIFCHSFGTGKLLTRVLLRRRTRRLLHILIDADKLDMLSTSRLEQLCVLASARRVYHVGYNFLIWYNLASRHVHVKTPAAKEKFSAALATYAEWLYSPRIVAWHVKEYGRDWVTKRYARFETILLEPILEKK